MSATLGDSAEETTANRRVPVTVLTGFLGSGKTTLLNQILTQEHGKRIAVIENEFGEIGIDNELVIGADEEIFEMNNGCICCTVRGDLIRILGSLMNRKDKFDYIMVETTGLADPGPVAQTFFVDDEMREKLSLDAIVTVVDARHVCQHLGESPECQEQIAFADVILLNKTDLVSAGDLEKLEAMIRSMNRMAQIHRTERAEIAMDRILNVRAFDLEKGPDIFRMKGVLNLRGADERFVFQGVHMLFDGKPERPWAGDERKSQIVFIGRNLNREDLVKGFRSCLA